MLKHAVECKYLSEAFGAFYGNNFTKDERRLFQSIRLL